MPRTPRNYSKMCFYRLVCRDPTVGETYVGSTTNVVKRRNKHKRNCTNENDHEFNYPVYQFIRRMGGWDNWQLLVIEQLAMADGIAAALRERHWTEHFKATLNKQVQGRTVAEYYVDHREEVLKRITAWQAANEAHLKTKHDCPCGGKYVTGCKSKHFKTARHVAYLAALPAV